MANAFTPGPVANLRLSQIVLLSWLISCSAAVSSQELEPRSYTNLPVGQTFLVLGYGRSDGDLSPTPSAALQDAEMTINAGILGFAHTFAIADSSAKLDFAASRLCYSGSATFEGEFAKASRCEYADAKVRVTWNFYGAPAMALKEFTTWEPGLVIGTSMQVSIPVGEYDSDQIINAGADRWMIRPGLGMSYRYGRWHVDVMGSIRWFEDNDDFYDGARKEQAPLYSVQSHVVYGFPGGRWFSLDVNYFWGGRSQVNDVRQDDVMDNSRFGITYSTPITRHHSLKFYAHTGVITRVGNEFDTYGLAWKYRF